MELPNLKSKMKATIPELTEASVADKANIDPNTGPIHGVHPKAKAAPTNKGKA